MVVPNFNHLLGELVAGAIAVYQRTLSPDHGWFRHWWHHGFCRFYPTCSEYSRQTMLTHGFGKGLILTIKRVSRCHPWSEPQIDNPPLK